MLIATTWRLIIHGDSTLPYEVSTYTYMVAAVLPYLEIKGI